MFDVTKITNMQTECVARWHREPCNNSCSEVAAASDDIMIIAGQQHQFNYLLWHEEDIARSLDVTDSQIAIVKRNIDRYNQQRNDWIEKIDDWITDYIKQFNLQSAENSRLNTETPGSATDRLSIMSLRIYHLVEQLDRNDIDDAHRDKVNHRLAICRLQHNDLSQSLRELVDDILHGRKRHRTYRQLKMYNDPTLNPYLYARSATVS